MKIREETNKIKKKNLKKIHKAKSWFIERVLSRIQLCGPMY